MNPALQKLPGKEKDKLKKVDMPDWMDPMLATLTHDYFSDPAWIFERKLDGERCLFFKNGDQVRLLSRNKKLQNAYYPEITRATEGLPGDFVLDGELVTFEGETSSFSRLQNRMHVKDPDKDLIAAYPVFAYLFDLLYLDGYDLTQLPLEARKKILGKAFEFKDPLRLLPHRKESGESFLKEACAKGWEGLIAKEVTSPYLHKRSRKWLKFKCGNRQEFVIAGYTEPKGERTGFGALLIGYFQKGALMFAGRVGTGFTDAFLEEFRKQMEQHKRRTCPFDHYEDRETGVTWITPKFVGEVGFTEWTPAGKLRHPRFLGLRNDKPAREVVRE